MRIGVMKNCGPDEVPDRRPLLPKGTVLFVGSVFSSAPYGSHVVMRELLRNYSAESFWILTEKNDSTAGAYELEDRTLRLPLKNSWWYRIPYGGCLRALMFFPQARRWVMDKSLSAIVAVYPSLDFLPLAMMLSRLLHIPFFVYLHDTLYEALSKSKIAKLVRIFQSHVFDKATGLFVISEGMQEFYRKRYNRPCVVVPHSYPEKIDSSWAPAAGKTLFWGGGIYGINDCAVMRVAKVATRLGIKLLVTVGTAAAQARIALWRERGLLVEAVFYESRADYLSALKKQGALLLALNRPEESVFGKDELATIFPTKVPEYLASGRPIVLNCPEDYYLSRYFRKHRCGLVINAAEEDEIEKALRRLFFSGDDVEEICRNALRKAGDFEASRVALKFSTALATLCAQSDVKDARR
jgi:hypothetical protein